MSEENKFEGYGIVEVMGRHVYAGKVKEEEIFGGAMCRVDVPAVADHPAYTKYIGLASIYCFTPCSEEAALAVARRTSSKAINIYIPELYPVVEKRPALREPDPAEDEENDGNDRYYSDPFS